MKKIIIIILFIILCFIILTPNKVSVITYHSISKNITDNLMVINQKEFEKQMKFLSDNKFTTLTLDDMNCYMNKKCKIKKNTVLVTLDDGYLDNYELAFPILKKYNINAVVFLIGSNVRNNSAGFINNEYILKTKKEYPNIEFASHGFNLHESDTSNYTLDNYLEDFKLQKEVIDTKYFSYPHGTINDELITSLKKNKYELAFGFGPDFRKASNKDNKYNIPRLSINGNIPLWKFKLRLLLPF